LIPENGPRGASFISTIQRRYSGVVAPASPGVAASAAALHRSIAATGKKAERAMRAPHVNVELKV
jgi:hypothetical protein